MFTRILISDLPHRLSPDLQSPGHDSVSSSVTVGSGASSGCRNSTTSTDSGRGSSEGGGASLSHTAGVKPGGRPGPQYGHQHRSVSSLHVSITQCHPQAVQCLLVPVLSVLLPGLQPPVSPLQQLQHPGQVSSLQTRFY